MITGQYKASPQRDTLSLFQEASTLLLLGLAYCSSSNSKLVVRCIYKFAIQGGPKN